MKIKRRIGKLIHSKQTLSQAVVLITSLTLLSKGFGFLRDMIVAYYFGTGKIMDAFVSSQTPLNFTASVIMGAVATVFIPLFIRVRKNKGEKESEHFSATVFYLSILAISSLVAVMFVFPRDAVKLFFPGFSSERLILTAKFVRWMSFATLLTATTSFLNSLLRSERKFLAYPMVGIGFDFVVIGLLFVAHKLGAVSLAIAWTGGPLFMVAVLGFAERKYLNPFKVKRHMPEMRELLKMVAPMFFSSAFGMLNTIIDRTFASTLNIGAISALMFARRISGATTGVLGTPVMQASYPSISSYAANENMEALNLTVKKTMKLLSFFLIPVSFALFPLAKGIIGIVFQRGNFTYQSTLLTYPPLIAAGISLFTASYNGVLVRIYYAFKDTKTPMYYGIVGIGFNILLNFLFIHPLKQTGLALSTSLVSFYFTIAILISLRRKLKIWFFDTWYFLRVVSASALMTALMYPFMIYVHKRERYILATLVGLGAYFLFSRLFRTLPKNFMSYLKFKKVDSDNKENL
ncbi:murein biosynthesis integral membrane protein MurJ [Mesoaciditoga lauensis]|uniref:murein biosynthesis integral membrane protein MurJ n=1 Tax=Mesoaciditoga lauensis TaxID=1495039 RepID=UPI00056CE765|nr:murein biosynthesis integral membrane protein MurJ [Mesoaciditoga lauensis]